MANENLKNARTAKNDEFYTQYSDIEKEMNAYLEFDADVFRDKTVLLPCDDPEWSNFTKYFAQNFERLGLRKLISTSYAPTAKAYSTQPTLFESESPLFDPTKTRANGKIFTLYRDTSGDSRIDVDDLEWDYLAGDGDFRSDEVKKLRDEADIIITNPPFMHADDFILRGIELGCDVIVLLRLMAQEGVDGKHKGSGVRSKLIDEHLVRVWLGRERLPMMHREGWTGPKIKGGNSGAPFAWFVFEARPHASDQGYVTRRISWRVPVPRAETDLFAGAEGWL